MACGLRTPRASNNGNTRISDKALLAMPFIAELVGVDEFTPTRLVYAMYDSSLGTVRFVFGDGRYTNPETVCFIYSFRGGDAEEGHRQRLQVAELYDRAARYFDSCSEMEPETLERHRGLLQTTDQVKGILEFYSTSELMAQTDYACDAINILYHVDGAEPIADEWISGCRSRPCVPLGTDPKWNFDPRPRPQQRVDGITGQAFKEKYEIFKAKYNYPELSWDQFQQAAFCLVGLKDGGFVSSLNVQRHEEAWTIDCFLSRWGKFEQFFRKMCFFQTPNPLYWLEAEMDDELKHHIRGTACRMMRPWKGLVEGNAVPAVVDWDTLRRLKWKRKDSVYPRPFSSLDKPFQVLDDQKADEATYIKTSLGAPKVPVEDDSSPTQVENSSSGKTGISGQNPKSKTESDVEKIETDSDVEEIDFVTYYRPQWAKRKPDAYNIEEEQERAKRRKANGIRSDTVARAPREFQSEW